MRQPRPTRQQIRRRRRVAGAAIALAATFGVYLIAEATLLAPADTHGAGIAHLEIQSQAVGQELDVDVVIPAGEEGLRPLLVFLHGRNETFDAYADDERFFAALAALGPDAPIVAFPAGSEDSYWHDRSSGDWGTHVIDEVIPAVGKSFQADPQRVAIGGISMGGFGAYDLALRHPGHFCAVGGHSPALWLHGADTAAGAFDDAEDFERHDVIGALRADPGAFGAIPVWNDAGTADPFLIADVALVELLEPAGVDLRAHVWAGGHDHAYWGRHWNAYLRFYARALEAC